MREGSLTGDSGAATYRVDDGDLMSEEKELNSTEQALREARQVLKLTAVMKRPNPVLIRLAQAVVDLSERVALETVTR
jgi:hypothetical protein